MKKPIKQMMLLALCLPFLSGCASYQKRKQLEKVARDWSLTIRASQVIPVYPLTEDLIPGDIMIAKDDLTNRRIYKGKGFLPLEDRVGRMSIDPDDYELYYEAVEILDNKITPYRNPGSGDGVTNAPRVGFPSYTFEVSSGAGANMAAPVSGVPVAMSILGSSSAVGSVSMKDCYTYGIDSITIYEHLKEWLKGDGRIKTLFDQFGVVERDGKSVTLRVVSRVFMVKTFDIGLKHSGSFGFEGGAGADKEVGLFQNEADALAYTTTIEALNASLAENIAPGGKLKVAFANKRSVSMVEEFDSPLVVGYHGFDFKMTLPEDSESGGASVLKLNSGEAIDPEEIKFTTKATFEALR